MPVRYGSRTVRLPYTGVNPVIEREQMRGLFFEHEELTFLAERCPRGMRIVDAGANTGNHTLFFASVMEAETVIPIEPQPRAAAALRAAVEANRLANVDLSLLGRAVGSADGRLDPVLSAGRRARRDALRPLPGRRRSSSCRSTGWSRAGSTSSRSTLRAWSWRCWPARRVSSPGAGRCSSSKCSTRRSPQFMSWIDANHYRVEKLFPDKTHCNYFVVPAERAGREVVA